MQLIQPREQPITEIAADLSVSESCSGRWVPVMGASESISGDVVGIFEQRQVVSGSDQDVSRVDRLVVHEREDVVVLVNPTRLEPPLDQTAVALLVAAGRLPHTAKSPHRGQGALPAVVELEPLTITSPRSLSPRWA